LVNIVTIDPSLNSTALTINGKLFSIVTALTALTKKQELSKWFKLVEPYCNILVSTIVSNVKLSFSKSELDKLEKCSAIAETIKEHILEHCEPTDETLILMEGYSYSSTSGPLIDLVCLSTLIRYTLTKIHNCYLIIIPPSSLKKLAAQLTYTPINVGKKIEKLEYRNKEGIMGGSFKKHEMFKALIDNNNITTDWVDFLRCNKEEILNAKSIPKPIDDLNDAIIMYHVTQKILASSSQNLPETIKILENTR
jgi:hypothetical protein